jgi:serine/threonine-protein kinase HipA
MSRPEAISLFTPELPLRTGWIDPPEGMAMAGCLWDSSPDSWGQRVIIARLTGLLGAAADEVALERTTFLIESGSNRIGGLDFQASPTVYVPRAETATLDELHAAVDALQAGELHAELFKALVDGTAVGGARPKVVIRDHDVEYIAKFSVSSDPYPVVKAEAVGMELARRVGIDAPGSRVVKSLGRDALLIERFDRPSSGERRMMVSGLTMLGFDDFLGARYSSYPEILNVLRQQASSGKNLGRTLFERIVFNIAIGNTDDHARNHAAFWDGQHLELTPAYDLCPQLRSGGEANQAMDISQSGARSSRFDTCVKASAEYGLTEAEARDIIDHQVTTIRENWDEVADLIELTTVDRNILLSGPILNPYAFTT